MAGIPYSLKFGAATSDRVNHGVMGGTLTQCSVFQWFFPTTLTGQKRLFEKGTTTPGTAIIIRLLNGDPTMINMFWQTNNNLSYNFATVLTVNKWWCFLATFNLNGAANSKLHFYLGSLVSPMIEIAPTVLLDDTTTPADPAGNVVIGNAALSATPTNAIQGMIASYAVVPGRVALIDEAITWRKNPYTIPRGARIASIAAANGNGLVIDHSGSNNHGTITGAIPTNNNLPIGRLRSSE